MTDDDPLDLAQVAADHDGLEHLLNPMYDQDDDAALQLLRHLVDDVNQDLPDPQPVPGSRGSTVVTIAGARRSESRLARNGALVAVLTAGAVSLSGVAAASTLVPEGYPLHGMGEVVRSAAGAVVDAVSLPEPTEGSSAGGVAGDSVTRTPSAGSAGGVPGPTHREVQPAPGAAVAATARSQAAARSVAALLDAAEQLLAEGRADAASARLVTAERHLADVLPAHAEGLAARLARLKRDIEAATQPKAPAKDQPAQQQNAPRKQEPPAKQESSSKQEPPAQQGRPSRQPEPRKGPPGTSDDESGGSGAASVEGLMDRAVDQPSRDASTKPRA